METIFLLHHQLPKTVTKVFKIMFKNTMHPSIYSQIICGVFTALQIVVFSSWILVAVLFNQEILDVDYCNMVLLCFLALNVVLILMKEKLRDLFEMDSPLRGYARTYYLMDCSVEELLDLLKGYKCTYYIPEIQSESKEDVDKFLSSIRVHKHPLYIEKFSNPFEPEAVEYFIADSLLLKPLFIEKDEETGEIYASQVK